MSGTFISNSYQTTQQTGNTVYIICDGIYKENTTK